MHGIPSDIAGVVHISVLSPLYGFPKVPAHHSIEETKIRGERRKKHLIVAPHMSVFSRKFSFGRG